MVAETKAAYDVSDDPDRLYWDEIVERGRALRESHDRDSWALGELAATVETRYGERDLQKFADAIGVNVDTLDTYRRIARRFPRGSRTLALGVFQALARLEDDAERAEWLERAEREKWTVSRARREVAATFNAPPVPERERQGAKVNIGMRGGQDKAVTMFENIAAGFEALVSETEYVEKDDAARGMTPERRRAAERAVQRAQEFVEYWADVLTLEVSREDWGA